MNKRNRIKCLMCQDIIESMYRHDFVRCKCGTHFVDGGTDYTRIGGDFRTMRIVNDDDTLSPVIEEDDEQHKNIR